MFWHHREWLHSFCSEDSLPFLLLAQVFSAFMSSSSHSIQLCPLSHSTPLPPLRDPSHLLPFCDVIHHLIQSFSFPATITEYREVAALFFSHLQLSIALNRLPDIELLLTLQLLRRPTETLYETLLCFWGIEPSSRCLQTLQAAVETNEEESLSFRAFLDIRIARILLRQIPCVLPSRDDSPFERTVQFVVYKRLQLGRRRFLQWVVLFVGGNRRVESRRRITTLFSNFCQISIRNFPIALFVAIPHSRIRILSVLS